MKFVMTQALCAEGMAMLDGTASVYVGNDPDPGRYLAELQDADALIVRIGRCDGKTMEASPKLKVIGRTGVGYDTVDVEKATELGIPVVITPGANNRSVAEHAVAMLFALAKNLVEGHQELTAGNWEIRGAQKTFELEGKTVGVIGLGAIGRETAKLCQACGMHVAGYDPFLSREVIEALGATYYADYEALLRESDLVTIHVPLTEQTRNMIDRRQLEQMKKTAVLVNCSRGGIVSEDALVEALRGGVIAGAAIDVFCHEPPERDDPLLHCPNLVVSPHAAAQTREAVIKMAQACVAGCLAVCRGEKWPHVANPQVYEHPRWK